MLKKSGLFVLAGLLVAAMIVPCDAQQKSKKAKPKPTPRKAKTAANQATLQPVASLATPLQEDFPAICTAADGSVLVAYIEYDGTADRVRLARHLGDGFEKLGTLSEPGNVCQPCLARDADGTVWCVWSQLEDGRWNLLARAVRNGAIDDTITSLTNSKSNDILPDIKADRHGRVWVAWQSFAEGHGDIFVKYHDPATSISTSTSTSTSTWSDPIRVTDHPTGDWEPRLAFGARDEALVVFDSYRRGDFDVYLARVSPDGKVKIAPIAATDRYEARAEAAASNDGNTLWVAYEDGITRWGKDLGSEWRKLGGGLQYDRHLYLASVDLETGDVSKVGDLAPLTPQFMATLGTANSGSICLPEVVVDRADNPWLFYRCGKSCWKIAAVRYDAAAKAWSVPEFFNQSTHCQDRRASVCVDSTGILHVGWPSDGRKADDAGTSAVYLGRIDPSEPRPNVDASILTAEQPRAAPDFTPVNNTPERDRDDRHAWQFDGTDYQLYWGDLHRHTDFSNCRTSDDGCILEHYRYGLDACGLDYLATTDHSDQGTRGYTEYEWWQNQKLADLFHNPDFFLTFYGYEREQRWPYGHRNVIYLERGGPIIYIQRKNVENSRWADQLPLPPEDGARKGELPPWQLWDLLKTTGMRVTTIEHTPGGGMGTDWAAYDKIDSQVETVVEIYQGSRNSYEGSGLPQPEVAAQKGPMDFGQYSAGSYQNALRLGHKLGVFASSDHRSTNISFGGVYVTRFDREGILDAIDARRTIAGTDKIFIEFSANGHLLGDIFETSEKPTLRVKVEGTAPLSAVTILRNEITIRQFLSANGPRFEATFTDEAPLAGENRYYVRVEQADGNMGWTSPVWLTYKP